MNCPKCQHDDATSSLVVNPKGGWIMKLTCKNCLYKDDVIKFVGNSRSKAVVIE